MVNKTKPQRSKPPVFIGFLAILAVIGIVYLAYTTLFTNSKLSSQIGGGSTTNSYAILSPAKVPPKVSECSAPLSYASNGDPSPAQCASGSLNILAWNAVAALEPTVLTLGYSPSLAQVQAAICHDGNVANADSSAIISAPIENTAYLLASLYYGWNFNINPLALLSSGC